MFAHAFPSYIDIRDISSYLQFICRGSWLYNISQPDTFIFSKHDNKHSRFIAIRRNQQLRTRVLVQRTN